MIRYGQDADVAGLSLNRASTLFMVPGSGQNL